MRAKKKRGLARAFSMQFSEQHCLLAQINMLQRHIEQLDAPQVSTPLNHHFAPNMYGREILLPEGSLVVGKTHRHAHLNVISKGRVTVVTESGLQTFAAPCTFVSDVGTKRAVYAHEDTVWTTIHANPTNTTNLDEIESDVIVDEDRVAEFRLMAGLDSLSIGASL